MSVAVESVTNADVTADAEAQEQASKGRPTLVPTRFEKAVVSCPCLCCWSWFAFAMVWTMLANVLLSSGSLNFDVNGVWDVRNSEVQTQYDAFVQAREALATNESELANYKPRSQPMVPVHIVIFSEEDTNLLSTEMLTWVRDIEMKVMEATGVEDHCMVTAGVDLAVSPLPFASLDPATDKISVTGTAPANGTDVLFRGISSILLDGGMYTANVDSDGAMVLTLRDSQFDEVKVDFGDASEIASGSFWTVKKQCTSMQSVNNYAFPEPEAQKSAMCSAYVSTSTVDSSVGAAVDVIPKICGCDSTSPVHGASGSCGTDCTGSFGVTAQCTSPAYVESSVTATQDEVNAELAKFCPGYTGLAASEEPMYKSMRTQVLPSSFSCSGASDVRETKSIRSVLWIGGPVDGYTKISGSTVNDQVSDLMKWAQGTSGPMGQSKGDGFLDAVVKIENDANKEKEGKASVVIMGSFLLQAAYFKLMAVEGLYAIGSIWFVWMWIWCATGSSLLATVGIFEAIISLPMAMATWGLLGQKYVGFLCVMMVFVILGIGADDIFVLYDAWKQSGQLGFPDNEEGDQMRFAWSFRRAGSAMAVTTATTIFCFMAAGFADIPTISGFGFFAALVVFWDYFLCMTLFASALIVYHRYFERRNLCCMNAICTGHMCCCPCQSVMYDSERPLWRQWKMVVPFSLLLLVGLIAIVAGVQVYGAILICMGVVYIHAQVSSSVIVDSKARPIETFCENSLFPLLQRNARKFMAVFALLVVTAAVLVGVGLRLPDENAKFLNENNPIQKYIDSQAMYSVGGDPMMEMINVIFGMNKAEALNRDGVDYQTPGSSWGKPVPDQPLGVVQYDAGAQQALFSSAGQTEVIQMCDALRHDLTVARSDENCHLVTFEGVGYPRLVTDPAALVSSGVLAASADTTGETYYVVQDSHQLTEVGEGPCDTGVYCFMYDVRDYLLHFCAAGSSWKATVVANHGAEYEDLCLDDAGNTLSLTFPSDDLSNVLASNGYKLYTKVARNAGIMNGMAFNDYLKSRNTGVAVENGEFRFAWLGLNATFPRGIIPHGDKVDLYDHFTAFFDSKLTVNSQAFMASYQWNWMITTDALLRNTIQSTIVAVAFCWFVLVLTTWNILVGTIAVSAVVCVIAGAAGMMVIMGWSLGIIESIACIVIIGISVDYSVHIAHAYNVAETEATERQSQREAKARSAVGTIGISLVSGCVTSLGATLFLMFCQINFFRMFGTFLFLTLVVSFLVAFLFLIPTLVVVGPGKDQGRLPRISIPSISRS